MFPIQGSLPAAGAAPKRPAAATARSAGFDVARPSLGSGEASAPGVAGSALTGMLALQEGAELQGGDSPPVQDRQARRRGRDLLDALTALQHSVLGGGVDVDSLRALAALAAAPAAAADPGLRRIVGEIRLRACVELARYEVG